MLAFASYVLIKQPKAGTVRANVIKELKMTSDIRRAECYIICTYVYVRTFEMSLINGGGLETLWNVTSFLLGKVIDSLFLTNLLQSFVSEPMCTRR